MPPRVTLKDIATKTGLSVSSVSLALRGDKRFPQDTITKVRDAAQSLGYIYNQAAADLRNPRRDTVAVCLGDLSNPIFNDMLISAENEVHQRSKRLLLGITRESRSRQADFLRQALQIWLRGASYLPCLRDHERRSRRDPMPQRQAHRAYRPVFSLDRRFRGSSNRRR